MNRASNPTRRSAERRAIAAGGGCEGSKTRIVIPCGGNSWLPRSSDIVCGINLPRPGRFQLALVNTESKLPANLSASESYCLKPIDGGRSTRYLDNSLPIASCSSGARKRSPAKRRTLASSMLSWMFSCSMLFAFCSALAAFSPVNATNCAVSSRMSVSTLAILIPTTSSPSTPKATSPEPNSSKQNFSFEGFAGEWIIPRQNSPLSLKYSQTTGATSIATPAKTTKAQSHNKCSSEDQRMSKALRAIVKPDSSMRHFYDDAERILIIQLCAVAALISGRYLLCAFLFAREEFLTLPVTRLGGLSGSPVACSTANRAIWLMSARFGVFRLNHDSSAQEWYWQPGALQLADRHFPQPLPGPRRQRNARAVGGVSEGLLLIF